MMGSVIQKVIGSALVCALFCVIQSGWIDSTVAEPSEAPMAAYPSVTESSGAALQSSEAPSAQIVMEKLVHSPAVFIENQGQWEDETIRFALSSMGANVGLTDEGVRFQLFQRETEKTESATRGLTPEERSNDVSVPGRNQSARDMLEFAARFEGARRVVPEGEGRSEQVFHYRRGEQARWRENVPSWEALVYRNLYDGIDLRVTGKRTGIKFEFIVAPGADWRQIRVRYDGIQGLALRDDGSLEIRPGEGWTPLVDGAPYIYQEIDGRRHAVEGRFALVDSKTWRFEISGDFDPARQLIIDPELEWSTYLGGRYGDDGYGIAVDGSGNIVVTGRTVSSGWVSGGFDTTQNGGGDAFVVKLSPSGAHLWSTYLGGSDGDGGKGIAVDGSGNIVVTGNTSSSGWVSGGFDTTLDGVLDAFVAKLSPSGAHLWSTYLGGSVNEQCKNIAVDRSGNIVVTGDTGSSGWVSGGFDTTLDGYVDAFVAKLSPSGAHLWSTYLGGSKQEDGEGIAVDVSGNILVTGRTLSSGWVSGGFDITFNGGQYDAFVAKLGPSGAHLWSTYLGGTSLDHGEDIAVDGSGNIVLTGLTRSSGWISGGFDATFNGGVDTFVAKLSPSGAHLWSTYLGGSDNDDGYGIAVDGSGNIVVTGRTDSIGWVSGGFDTTYNGGALDVFVAKLSPSGAHLWSSYLGGSVWEEGQGIAVAGAGNIVVTGVTLSSGWVSGGFDTTYNDYGDAFVAKIRDDIEPTQLLLQEISIPDETSIMSGGVFHKYYLLKENGVVQLFTSARVKIKVDGILKPDQIISPLAEPGLMDVQIPTGAWGITSDAVIEIVEAYATIGGSELPVTVPSANNPYTLQVKQREFSRLANYGTSRGIRAGMTLKYDASEYRGFAIEFTDRTQGTDSDDMLAYEKYDSLGHGIVGGAKIGAVKVLGGKVGVEAGLKISDLGSDRLVFDSLSNGSPYGSAPYRLPMVLYFILNQARVFEFPLNTTDPLIEAGIIFIQAMSALEVIAEPFLLDDLADFWEYHRGDKALTLSGLASAEADVGVQIAVPGIEGAGVSLVLLQVKSGGEVNAMMGYTDYFHPPRRGQSLEVSSGIYTADFSAPLIPLPDYGSFGGFEFERLYDGVQERVFITEKIEITSGYNKGILKRRYEIPYSLWQTASALLENLGQLLRIGSQALTTFPDLSAKTNEVLTLVVEMNTLYSRLQNSTDVISYEEEQEKNLAFDIPIIAEISLILSIGGQMSIEGQTGVKYLNESGIVYKGQHYPTQEYTDWDAYIAANPGRSLLEAIIASLDGADVLSAIIDIISQIVSDILNNAVFHSSDALFELATGTDSFSNTSGNLYISQVNQALVEHSSMSKASASRSAGPVLPALIMFNTEFTTGTFAYQISRLYHVSADQPLTGLVTITIPYDYQLLPRTVNENDLAIYWFDEANGRWAKLPSIVNAAENTVSCQSDKLGTFAVFIEVELFQAPTALSPIIWQLYE